MTARDFLYEKLKSESEEYFGNHDKMYLSSVCNAWMDDEFNSAIRYDEMTKVIGSEIRSHKILDMASGCGSFVFYGLMNGYNVYGIEPEKWKHEFNGLKAREYDYPKAWMNRFSYGIGEALPFDDQTFDVISTYQTLEHVQSHEDCFGEFKRVLKKGGYLFIRCPDYSSFFEGHYRVPMLPLMNRNLFRKYLKLLKRPTKGLDTINYTYKKKIYNLLGDDYQIHNLETSQIKEKLRSKTNIDSELLANAYLLYSRIKNIFRSESSISFSAKKLVE